MGTAASREKKRAMKQPSAPLKAWLQNAPPLHAIVTGVDDSGHFRLRVLMQEAMEKVATPGENSFERAFSATFARDAVSLVHFTAGGRGDVPAMQRVHFANAHALIFIVDSTKPDLASDNPQYSFWNSAWCLQHYLSQSLFSGPVLVLSNRAGEVGSIPSASPAEPLSSEAVAKQLGLDTLRERPWKVQECDLAKGEGIVEGLQFLADIVSKAPKRVMLSREEARALAEKPNVKPAETTTLGTTDSSVTDAPAKPAETVTPAAVADSSSEGQPGAASEHDQPEQIEGAVPVAEDLSPVAVAA